jgi:hypothetical protein
VAERGQTKPDRPICLGYWPIMIDSGAKMKLNTCTVFMVAAAILTQHMLPVQAQRGFGYVGRWSGALKLRDGSTTHRTLVFTKPRICRDYLSTRERKWVNVNTYTMQGSSAIMTTRDTMRGRGGATLYFRAVERITPDQNGSILRATTLGLYRTNSKTGKRVKLPSLDPGWTFYRQ